MISKISAKNRKILLIGGLGHTDLSGKVPRPGLLMLRKALRKAGHDAQIKNYATLLMDQIFPADQVAKLATIYERSIKPFVVEGEKKLFHPFGLLRFILWDIPQIKKINQELIIREQNVYNDLAYEIAQQVRDKRFDAVGFPLYLGSSTKAAIIIANILREEFEDLPLIFGGPQTTHFAETIYQETQAPSALVLGEGETAIVEILNALNQGKLKDLSQIPNLAYRTEGGKILFTERKRLSINEWIEISAVPYEEEDFQGLMKYAFIETSRGCSHQCHFCSQPMLSGIQRYLKPAKNVVDEMIEINRRFGISHFEFVGSSTPPSQAEQIANELLNRGLQDKFSWVLFMRGQEKGSMKTAPEKSMNAIKRAGASAIFFGVEAAENSTLKKMGKGEKIENIEESMLAANNAGIATIGSFIYPYPGMPANEAELILRFLKQVRPLSAPVQALGLSPGTFCANNAEEIGCEIVYPDQGDHKLYLAGKKLKPTMKSPEVLKYLLMYPLILSLPMRFWPSLPYKIDGKTFQEYVKDINTLQGKIGKLGILTGFSHSHYLISQVLQLSARSFSERMFYCSLTGDPKVTRALIDLFNRKID
jgi:radical SAM superfamily enzyme YgiQ (UPF0313 family)